MKVPAAPVTLRLLSPPPGQVPEPLWLATTWEAAKHEVTSYLRTAWAFGIRPRATAHAWAERRFEALNPLAYLLNSLAILGPWRALWQRILHVPDTSFASDLTSAATPFLGVLAFGSLHHLLFRLLGSKRHLQSSWAISIYSTGGLPTVAALIQIPFSLRVQHATALAVTAGDWRPFWMQILFLQVVGLTTLVIQNAALAGLYGTSRRRAAGVQIASTFLAGVAIISLGTQLQLVGTFLKFLADRIR